MGKLSRNKKSIRFASIDGSHDTKEVHMRTTTGLSIFALLFWLHLYSSLARPSVAHAAPKGSTISTGNTHACAVITGMVYCWGNNDNGQLGNNDVPNDSDSAVQVLKESDGLPLTGATSVTSGFNHSCAIATGTVYCWGDNTQKQLGNKNYAAIYRAVPVLQSDDTPLTGVSFVEAGQYHTCAIRTGQVFCWGFNTFGQLGNNNAPTNSPFAVQAKFDSSDIVLSGATQLSSGTYSTCALIKGGAYCWGNNNFGQLGNNDLGTAREGAVPVEYADETPVKSVSAISMNGDHGCAIVQKTAYCWGYNSHGQLGDTTDTDRAYAVKVLTDAGDAFVGVTHISAGISPLTCAIAQKTAYCWGSSYFGEVGNNTDNSDSTSEFHGAVAVKTNSLTPFTAVTSISAGNFFACAIAQKIAYCWGKNDQGQLGNQNTGNNSKVTAQPTYLQPNVLNGFQGINASNHTCALRKGAVYCWGNNTSGQLGDGTTTDRDGAVATMLNASTPLINASSVDTGRNHSCATVKGNVYCWGANGNGQLGNNSTVDSTTPVLVKTSIGSPLTGATHVATSSSHSCAIAKGQVYCWGDNSSGKLGNNTTDPSLVATPALMHTSLTPLKGAKALTVGASHSCALISGVVYCWGLNASGQLGNNSAVDSSVAVAAQFNDGSAFTKVTAISAGANHTCALATAQVYCWGDNEYGQLGNNAVPDTDGAVLVELDDGSAFVGANTLSVGTSHSCAGTKAKQIYCWGLNSSGQLGNNSYTDTNGAVPVQFDGGSAIDLVTRIGSGTAHTCAVRSTQVYCWGGNSAGQLGNKDVLVAPDGAAPAYFFVTFLTGLQ
jgi:alpha-tubulin suppressor-like RCC1 family protein